MTFEFACRMGTFARPADVGQECPTYNFICRRLIEVLAFEFVFGNVRRVIDSENRTTMSLSLRADSVHLFTYKFQYDPEVL